SRTSSTIHRRRPARRRQRWQRRRRTLASTRPSSFPPLLGLHKDSLTVAFPFLAEEYRVRTIRSLHREGQELIEVVEAAPRVDGRAPPRSHVRPQQTEPPLQGSAGLTLRGEYAPSAFDWVREQVEAYERSGGT